MPESSPGPRPPLIESAPPWLRRAGVRSWLFLGVIALGLLIYAFLSAISGVVIPLIFATVISMLFFPVVDWLATRSVPRALGSTLVILALIAVATVVIWLMGVGIVEQYSTIMTQITAGIGALEEWLQTLNLPEEILDQILGNALSAAPGAASGVASFFTSSFSGAIAFAMGLFLGLFLLFYLLFDWHNISDWMKGNLGVPADLGQVLVADATLTIRLYYYALTLSSVVVSVTIGLTMFLLGLPLALTVALVTMITSYIPYLGAIVSGIFAFLVALGSGGLADALIVLGVVLLVQNIIQTLIQNKLASDQLKLHPLVTFLSTIIGGALFGLIGATLGTPVTAMLLTARRQMREYYEAQPAQVEGVSTMLEEHGS